MAWELPANRPLIPQAPPQRLRWPVVIMIGVIVLAVLAVLVDTLLH
jgi:hypothetical protein